MSRPLRDRTLRVSHLTHYSYAEFASLSLHKAFLTPRLTPSQTLHESHVSVDPQPANSTTHVDYYGNHATLFTIDVRHKDLRVEAVSQLTIHASPPLEPTDSRCSLSLEDAQLRIRGTVSEEDLRAYEFLFDSPYASADREFRDYGMGCFVDGEGLLVGVNRLMHKIHSEFRYDPTVTTVSTPVREVLRHKGGVCQDFAHLMIACLRSVGLPARYVSGYLVPRPEVIGAQASHAWVSVYCPGSGWTDFDPTNDVSPSGYHITLASGRDYSDVSPFRGVVVGGGEHEISVEVSVSDR